MPSPFPGMNPWIEQEGIWLDFHQRLLVRMAERIAEQVDSHYFVKIEEYLYIQETPESPRRMVSRADVGISLSGGRIAPGPSLAVLEAPVQVHLPWPDVEGQTFLAIRGRSSRVLITALELLSPTNKGRHRDQYLQKREQMSVSSAHFVEIDLLRGGEPLPAPDRPACDYSVLVSRAERRPEADFWPISLREPLPTIPIPLRNPDRDATLDLQALIHQIYDAGHYAQYLYEESPQPPLRPEDREWASGLIPAGG